MREVIPLRERRLDIAFLVYFVINLPFIVYFVDFEQIAIPNYQAFLDACGPLRDACPYPAWPPPWAVNMVHWWGEKFDPLLLARPPFWMVTIWVDALYFGPFYAFAIYAYARGREWIRIPSIIYGSFLFVIICCIMSEEYFGIHKTKNVYVMTLANLPWAVFPVLILFRNLRPHPFTRPASPLAAAAPTPAPAVAPNPAPATAPTSTAAP